MAARAICTIGHGNRSSEELKALLTGAGVRDLVDVRAHPGSRRHPQFSREALAAELGCAGIGYSWSGGDLGGRRRPKAGSRHTAWRNDSFRAYADHMESSEFAAAIDRLLAQADRSALAIMCAERLPWQCHRYLISDFLVAHGLDVMHLIAFGGSRPHTLNPIARVEGGALVYDRTSQMDLGLGD
jgi:uncharacterized protein (DUF488 family)